MRVNILLAIVCIACSINGYAQTHAHEFGFQSDNDSFLGQNSDRYYTNGLFLYYRHALPIKDTNDTRLKNKVLGIEAGQKIFNPISGAVPNKSRIDRPFAGYLYIGSTLNLLYANESNLKIGAQLGVIGPAALGEEVQTVIHNTFGFYHLNGWQYQIRNSFQLNLSGEYNRLLTRYKGADLSLNTYANLGTAFTGAGAGAMMRLGNFNQLFNSVSTQSTAIQKGDFTPLNKHEIFFYYKPMLNFVAYDATIQGGLFNDQDNTNREVTRTKKPFMFSNQLGVAYSGTRWVFDVAAILHSRDVKEMSRSHQWGAVTILYRFD